MRNLTAGEMVEQVNLVELDSRYSIPERASSIAHRVSNVVFMGMGEPLANYDCVLKAVRILNHPKGKNIGIRRLTISTCGLPEGIERLAEEDIQPRLAISLNAPTDSIRQKLMPIASRPALGGRLDRLLKAVGLYQRTTRNRVTFEYCLIKGVNDTVLHARLLAKRLRPFMCNVNLIEYNPVRPLADRAVEHLNSGAGEIALLRSTVPLFNFQPSGKEAIERFAKVLKDSGIETTVRAKMGQTINAACGQLGSSLKLKS
jgi:23S rRNA (adenine2503-C2)-methyltransferase